jgi:hypothetical protein
MNKYVYTNNISVISWRSVLLVEETGIPREKPNELTVIGITQIKKKAALILLISVTKYIRA